MNNYSQEKRKRRNCARMKCGVGHHHSQLHSPGLRQQSRASHSTGSPLYDIGSAPGKDPLQWHEQQIIRILTAARYRMRLRFGRARSRLRRRQ
jgi:hypothetical protein